MQQSSLEQKLFDIINNTINHLGFEVVKVTMQDQPKMLEILIDRQDDQKVSIKDCQTISRNISVLLDVQDVIADKYHLVVSSAGAERPLIKLEDYNKFLNRDIKVKLRSMINECNHYKGKIIKVENNVIYLSCNNEEIEIPFDLIKNANLVFTEEMFRKLLNK